MALRDGRLAARAGWWARPGDEYPRALDILDLDDSGHPETVDIAARLLSTAMAEVVPEGTQPPDYLRFLDPDWREAPATRQATEDRMAAAAQTGARLFVERLRLEWRPGTPVPAPTGRLTFRPVTDPDELLALMTEVMDGTLDAHDRDDLTRMPPREAAAEHYNEELAQYTSPRDWWRIAELPGGEPVGFVHPRAQRLQPDHRLPRRRPGAPRPRLHRRDPGRGHPGARRAGCPADQGVAPTWATSRWRPRSTGPGGSPPGTRST